MTNQLRLTLYNAPEHDNWADNCKCILEKQGMVVQKRGRSKLLAWAKNDLTALSTQLSYADVLEMSTVWLRPGRVGIRLHPRRLYFQTDNPSIPIKQREFDVLGNSNRPNTSTIELLRKTIDIANILVQEEVLLPCVMSENDSQSDVLTFTHALGKNGGRFELSKDLWRGLRNTKAYYIPEQFEIIVVHDTNEPKRVVNIYIDSLIKEWLPELGVEDPRCRIRRVSLNNALLQMKEVERGNRSASLGNKIFLVAISGKPGDPLPPQQKEFLKLLDTMKYQYRVFSYANTEPKWSARAQASSILQGAGGIPYQLMLPIPEEIDDCLIYGIDIGHDHREKRVSRVVVSVTDKYGSHIASVWMRQKLNEAAASETLGNMLRKARNIALSETGSSGKASIVLRDGRIPNIRTGSGAECLDTYLDALGPDTTVVECRKRGNPIMYIDGQTPSPAPAGYACSPEDSDARFVCTHDSLQGLASILKLHIPKGGDGLAIGINTMSRIVTGLSYSPSLGLRPHLPGPIYWADGIGKTGHDQYKFAGQFAYEFT